MEIMTLGMVAEYINGRAFKPEEWEEIGKPIIRIQNLTNSSDLCNRTTKTYEDKYLVSDGDLLFAWSASLGAHIWHGEDAWLNQHIFKILPRPYIEKKYLFYFLLYIVDQIYAKTHGSGMVHITLKPFKEIQIPIPTLKTQQCIIDRIESLFAKLDEAKEKAQAVVDGFEDRKAAILYKAFSGELTAEWRKKNHISTETWHVYPLENVCKSIYDGDHMPPPQSENGIPFLVISNVNTWHLSFQNIRYVPKEYYDTLTDTRKPELGDVLFTLVGSYGIPVVVDDNKPFCFQRHMALLKPSMINTYFLWYQLQTADFYKKVTGIATGTAQLTVPIKGLRKLTVVLPIEREQKEIVNILDMQIKKEQHVKELAVQVIHQIDTIKKSILARAFRGELGTNDPTDESAVELLKKIEE